MASIVLMVLGLIGFAMLAFASVFLVMVSDGCGSDGACDFDLMTAGFFVALLGPPIVYLASVVWTIVRLVRRRLAWWLPVVGALLALGVWAIGLAMLQASLGR